VKLQQILTFVAVYQERSFTAAANRIHATQSGLSMQIKELEGRIGVSLFERSPKGVTPTMAGQKLYRRALEIVRQVEGLREEMRLIRGEATGSVSVGLMPTFTRSALGPAIARFTTTYPFVKLKIFEAYSAVLTEMVSREELDFAIVPPTSSTDGIAAQHLARDSEVLVTAVTTSRKHLAPIKLSQAGPLKLIVPSIGNARRERLDRYLAVVGAEVESIIEMDAMMATLSLIQHSDWCSILPATLCHSDIDGARRKLHPLETPELGVDYVLITPAAKSMSAITQGFADELTDEIRRACSDWRMLTSGAPAASAEADKKT